MKKRIAMLLALCMVLTFVSCGSQTSAPVSGGGGQNGAAQDPAELPPFKISMITTLTGTETFGGAEYKNGAELAIQHLGGEINGRKIEMQVADGPNQDATISEFERLYNEGARVFLSGYGSLADRTFATMCDSMEVLYMSLCWDYDLIQGPSEYFFRTGARVDGFSGGTLDQCVGIGETYLGKSAEELKSAVVTSTSVESIATPFINRAEELGVQIVLKESYPIDTKDFVPIITKLQNTENDILVPFQLPIDGTPFQKKMYEMGYHPPVTVGAGIYYDTPVFADLGNEITNGVLTQSYVTSAIPDDMAKGIKEFREDYTEIYGWTPLAHALQAYGGVMLYAKVLEKVDPAQWEDTALLAQTLKEMDLDYGELPWYWGVKFDELNNNIRADKFQINQWVDGELYCVFPEELQTSTPKIPWTE